MERWIRSGYEALIGETVFLDNAQCLFCFCFHASEVIHPHIAIHNLQATTNLYDLCSRRIETDAIFSTHRAGRRIRANEEIIEGGLRTSDEAGSVHFIELDDR
jgi:hypothetical protein